MPSKTKCVIKGCNFSFNQGTIGWHRHVGSVSAHPYWHPEVESSDERMKLFRVEFPEFFPHTNGNGNGTAPVPPSPRVSLGRARLVQLLEGALQELRAT
jgi:hypothetical protein